MLRLEREQMIERLLHGILVANIYEVDKLYDGCGGLNIFNKENWGTGPATCGKRLLDTVKRVICGTEKYGSKVYATVDLNKARVARTRMVESKRSNPQWNETFRIYCAHKISNVIFTVKEESLVGAILIGRAYVAVEDILKGYIVDKWLDLLDEQYNPVAGKPRIHVKLQFISVNQDPHWSRGIKNPRFEGVSPSFFQQRHGCRITLYQDAHVPDDFNPRIALKGKRYEPHRCWEDIFTAISNAKHLIYVAGWSVYTQITLVRHPNRPIPGEDVSRVTLGELLKRKADAGVRVLLLVWDDRTSVQDLKRDGMMLTHDQETKAYFKDTKVHCVLCPRNPAEGEKPVQMLEVSSLFTHHQKTVIVDSEITNDASQKKRTIVGFLGGIDLCGGRYDNKDHPLFKTLDNVHHNDFHQPNFPGASIRKGGPREPWHDIHCKLEGPAAWDVLYNFEQRWVKQVGPELLIPQDMLEVYTTRPMQMLSSNDAETWNVQVFRSIDNRSAFGFPENIELAVSVGLVSSKGDKIDRSIQDAYINAIRRAKNFIYIENQYFIGSSFGWHKGMNVDVDDIGALNLIPKELSLKMVSKIEAGERFAVYIVIPMWPEGIPESSSVQQILDWQRRTIEMMYADITEALRRKGLNTNPREYLSFFCLGNRETENAGEYAHPEEPEPNSDYSRAQNSHRFMIYVHSKMMIVDDEYIIIGSANINERSMNGARDTEIAMGAFQPHHISTPDESARGEIYGFRMALWYEHLGLLEASFQHPESVECIQLVNQIADDQWEMYASPTFDQDLPGHLLSYPFEISSTGTIIPRNGVEHFPDTNAWILGTKADHHIPDTVSRILGVANEQVWYILTT